MASPLFRINGGAAGVKASVSAASAVTATLDSTDGVRSTEWFIDTTDETTAPGDYVLVQSGTVGETVSTTSLVAGTAAKLRARINGGINLATGQADPAATNASSKFFVPTALGREVGAAGEEFESDSTYGSAGIINAAVRDAGGVSFADVQAALATASSAIAFNGQDLTNVSGVKFRNDALTQDLDAVTKDAGDIVRIGENTDALGVRLSVATGGFIGVNVNNVEAVRVTSAGVAFQTVAAANITTASVAAGSGTLLSIKAGDVTAGVGDGGSLAFYAGINAAAETGNIVAVLTTGASGSTGEFLWFDGAAVFLNTYANAATTTLNCDRATLAVIANTTLTLGAGGATLYSQDATTITLTGILKHSGTAARTVERHTTLADGDHTLDVDFDHYRFATPAVARVIQLRTGTAPIPQTGERISFTRPATGAFTITIYNEGDLVNAIVTLTAGNFATAEVIFNGALWELSAFSPNATPGPSA